MLVATYVIDNAGPVLGQLLLGSISVIEGTIITAGGTLTIPASDSSGMNRVEFYVDGILVGADFNGADGHSAPISIDQLRDGQHTILIK